LPRGSAGGFAGGGGCFKWGKNGRGGGENPFSFGGGREGRALLFCGRPPSSLANAPLGLRGFRRPGPPRRGQSWFRRGGERFGDGVALGFQGPRDGRAVVWPERLGEMAKGTVRGERGRANAGTHTAKHSRVETWAAQRVRGQPSHRFGGPGKHMEGTPTGGGYSRGGGGGPRNWGKCAEWNLQNFWLGEQGGGLRGELKKNLGGACVRGAFPTRPAGPGGGNGRGLRGAPKNGILAGGEQGTGQRDSFSAAKSLNQFAGRPTFFGCDPRIMGTGIFFKGGGERLGPQFVGHSKQRGWGTAERRPIFETVGARCGALVGGRNLFQIPPESERGEKNGGWG